MEITYQQRIGPDGQPLAAPVIPPTTTVDEIEAIVTAEGGAVMSDEQAAVLSAHLAGGGHPRRRRAVTPACRTDCLITQSFVIRVKSAITKTIRQKLIHPIRWR